MIKADQVEVPRRQKCSANDLEVLGGIHFYDKLARLARTKTAAMDAYFAQFWIFEWPKDRRSMPLQGPAQMGAVSLCTHVFTELMVTIPVGT